MKSYPQLFMVTEFCVKIISVRLAVKLNSLSREWICRHLRLNIKKVALLQDKPFYFNQSRALDYRFAVLKMAFDVLLTEISFILTLIRDR